MKDWYIIFEKPRLGWRSFLGHVRLAGYDIDRFSGTPTWVFLDPAFTGTQIDILYRPDDVQEALAYFFSTGLVLRIPAKTGGGPPLGLLTCASMVASMAGYRAFTPWGLKRQLLRDGATVIED